MMKNIRHDEAWDIEFLNEHGWWEHIMLNCGSREEAVKLIATEIWDIPRQYKMRIKHSTYEYFNEQGEKMR